MDNLSSDGTQDIAREYERAGYLHYIFQSRDDYSQGRWVTQMARLASEELHADWVINSDADEFWWPHAGSIKDALAAVESGAVAASAERTNFVARTANGEPFWRRMDVRRAASVNSLGQPLPPKVAHRALPGVVVAQGNHSASLAGEAVPSAAAPITILHFPVRSRAQFLNKIVKGGAAYARNTDLDPATGKTWRHLYQLYLDGKFDAAYAKEVVADDQIASGVATGVLVRDERLVAALGRRTQWSPAPPCRAPHRPGESCAELASSVASLRTAPATGRGRRTARDRARRRYAVRRTVLSRAGSVARVDSEQRPLRRALLRRRADARAARRRGPAAQLADPGSPARSADRGARRRQRKTTRRSRNRASGSGRSGFARC